MNNQPTPPKRGQPLKSKEGKRRQIPLNLSPSNFDFLEKMGRGKHDYLNYLLDKVREKILDEK